MPEKYVVVWKAKIEADTPVEAARVAYNMQRSLESRPTRFKVKHYRLKGSLREGYSLPVDLGHKNPLDRPRAVIVGTDVRCGHCDSENTLYIEDVEQHAELVAEDGVPYAYISDLEVDEIGVDPRVHCLGCGEESLLPETFEWKDAPEPERKIILPNETSKPYQVTWTADFEAEDKTEAARAALNLQRAFQYSATAFTVEGVEGVAERIDLGTTNPYGWPEATIENDHVCCPHCGSSFTKLIEEVSQRAPLWARFGIAYAAATDLEQDEEGRESRVECVECQRISALPDLFDWA